MMRARVVSSGGPPRGAVSGLVIASMVAFRARSRATNATMGPPGGSLGAGAQLSPGHRTCARPALPALWQTGNLPLVVPPEAGVSDLWPLTRARRERGSLVRRRRGQSRRCRIPRHRGDRRMDRRDVARCAVDGDPVRRAAHHDRAAGALLSILARAVARVGRVLSTPGVWGQERAPGAVT